MCVCVMKYPRLRSHLLATYYGFKQSAWLGTYVVGSNLGRLTYSIKLTNARILEYPPYKTSPWPTNTIFDGGYWWFGTWKTCIYQFAIVKNDMGYLSCKFPLI
ncbi:hypothetical protein ACN42_g11559 [Penicillium freii]|uniref:Uncharacterized protein n=1 Tax=Penicillium freii TaxID=48697 RepID=A0A117NK81_PENFR|nr:hypothetical protein ACN42_g11559 [Penicillium freii]